jgi:hypothetical protein
MVRRITIDLPLCNRIETRRTISICIDLIIDLYDWLRCRFNVAPIWRQFERLTYQSTCFSSKPPSGAAPSWHRCSLSNATLLLKHRICLYRTPRAPILAPFVRPRSIGSCIYIYMKFHLAKTIPFPTGRSIDLSMVRRGKRRGCQLVRSSRQIRTPIEQRAGSSLHGLGLDAAGFARASSLSNRQCY